MIKRSEFKLGFLILKLKKMYVFRPSNVDRMVTNVPNAGFRVMRESNFHGMIQVVSFILFLTINTEFEPNLSFWTRVSKEKIVDFKRII